MPDLQNLLGALQHADSFFPGGSIAFSWGLEGLHADGELVSPDQLAPYVEGQLRHRWATCDALALTAACRAEGSLDHLASLDAVLEAMTLATELREGSKRAGAALLNVHAKLDTAGAAEYRQWIAQGKALGHLPVVQGLVWTAAGLAEDACRAMAAHTFCTGMVSAALRLGMIGHLDAQKILLHVRPLLVELLALPADGTDAMCASTLQTEIASMRHEIQDSRLFAN